mmetsp:Transcript_27788/g.54110  ORF Transcript_27788/g.54110 Transcript_27788/m.54110 type:complete len:508 (-) Transcript_27788:2100-3623(-)
MMHVPKQPLVLPCHILCQSHRSQCSCSPNDHCSNPYILGVDRSRSEWVASSGHFLAGLLATLFDHFAVDVFFPTDIHVSLAPILGLQVVLAELVDGGNHGDSAIDLDPKGLQVRHFPRVVCHQPYALHVHLSQDSRHAPVGSRVIRKSKDQVRVYCVVTVLLHRVCLDLVGQAHAPTLLGKVDDHPGLSLTDVVHGEIELLLTIALQRTQDLGGKALVMAPHVETLRPFDLPPYYTHDLLLGVVVLVRPDAVLPLNRRQQGLGHERHVVSLVHGLRLLRILLYKHVEVIGIVIIIRVAASRRFSSAGEEGRLLCLANPGHQGLEAAERVHRFGDLDPNELRDVPPIVEKRLNGEPIPERGATLAVVQDHDLAALAPLQCSSNVINSLQIGFFPLEYSTVLPNDVRVVVPCQLDELAVAVGNDLIAVCEYHPVLLWPELLQQRREPLDLGADDLQALRLGLVVRLASPLGLRVRHGAFAFCCGAGRRWKGAWPTRSKVAYFGRFHQKY